MTMTSWLTKGWLGKVWPLSRRQQYDVTACAEPVAHEISDPPHDVSAEIVEDKVEPLPQDRTLPIIEADKYHDGPQPDDPASKQVSTLAELEVGQMILVRAGRNGSQRAEVVSAVQVAEDSAFVTVRKYRAKSDSWTKPVYCYAHQIIRPMTPADNQAPT